MVTGEVVWTLLLHTGRDPFKSIKPARIPLLMRLDLRQVGRCYLLKRKKRDSPGNLVMKTISPNSVERKINKSKNEFLRRQLPVNERDREIKLNHYFAKQQISTCSIHFQYKARKIHSESIKEEDESETHN